MKTGPHFSASIEPHAFRMAAPSVLRSHGAARPAPHSGSEARGGGHRERDQCRLCSRSLSKLRVRLSISSRVPVDDLHAGQLSGPLARGALAAVLPLFPPLPLGGGQILRDCVTNGREGAQIRKDRLQIVIG